MADLQGRKIFKVFNQDFIVDERYTVTKELGQGAYGIVWYALALLFPLSRSPLAAANMTDQPSEAPP
jgi:mitogen-activated protein kinase 7